MLEVSAARVGDRPCQALDQPEETRCIKFVKTG